jgi:hypothetical protein
MTVVTVQTLPLGSASIVSGASASEIFATLFTAAIGGLSTAANVVALCWFGMWMGMTSKTANLATLKTILFVQILPWFVLYFASSIVTMLVLFPRFFKGGSTNPLLMVVWYPLISSAVAGAFTLAKDIAFFVWARRNLYCSFREQASHAIGQPRLVAPPYPPLPVAAPPVIPAQP